MVQLSWEKLLSAKTLTQRTTAEGQSERDVLDGRSPYDSDLNRIIFSYPFRRLQDKAQLFPLEANDFVRTRLTHSLEVATLAKSLGISIAKQIEVKRKNDFGWKTEFIQDLPKVLECAGLVHDLGNPPFGHFGEKTIGNSLYAVYNKLSQEDDYSEACDNFTNQQVSDIKKFEGNSQSFRILTHLQCIRDEHGYHMTSALLASIMKYPVPSDKGNKKNENKDEDDIRFHKFGYFYPENDIAKEIFENTGLIDKNDENAFIRHPLAFLMEAADDLAYCAGDVEDGFKKGLFSFNDLIKDFEEYNENCKDSLITEFIDIIKSTVAKEEYYSEEKKIQEIRIKLQQKMLHSIIETFMENYDLLMTGKLKKDLVEISPVCELRNCLKNITEKYLFSNKNVITKELMGKELIEYLVKLYSDGLFQTTEKDGKKYIKFDGRIKELIASDYLKVFKSFAKCGSKFDDIEISTNNIYYILLLIADQISGMTDTYCMSLYKKLNAI